MSPRATRDAIGEALYELGKEDERIVVIDNDIGGACKTDQFKVAFPLRHFNVGIAEQNGAGIAAGMAASGKIPFVVTFAAFASMRMAEMIRQEMCYPRLNVKIIGSHAGLTTASNGASHQSVEDVGIFRSFPHMTIVMAADYPSAVELTKKAAYYPGPVYLRYTRADIEDIYTNAKDLEIGKAVFLKEGKDAAILANGDTVRLAIRAADILLREGIRVSVLDVHTVKPLDKDAVRRVLDESGKLVSVEDHNVIGGLGSAVAEVIAEEGRGILRRVGINDEFGQCGTYEELMDHYGITAETIAEAVRELCRK